LDLEDTLVWVLAADEIYSPKAGYTTLCAKRFVIDINWWWRGLWKLHCPAKAKLLWWSIMENKVPTWDNLQKRSFVGPGRCSLRSIDLESGQDLFMDCNVVKKVWV